MIEVETEKDFVVAVAADIVVVVDVADNSIVAHYFFRYCHSVRY